MTESSQLRSVFLSHSSGDNEFCERLALDLTTSGIQLWYDSWEIKVGDSLRQKISAGIQSHEFLAVVLSKKSVKSQWVQVELNAALSKELEDQKVVVLPVLIEDCEIPVFLRDKKYADFRGDYLRGLQELLAVLGVGMVSPIRGRSGLAKSKSHRNDELSFSDEDFEEWMLDLLDANRSIHVLRVMRNWREASRAIQLQQSAFDGAPDQLELETDSAMLLDKLVIAGSLFVILNQPDNFRSITEIMCDAYQVINSTGREPGPSSDWNTLPALARCQLVDRIYALGSLALEARNFALLPDLIRQIGARDSYWSKRSWFRYTLTMAARATPDRAKRWYLPTHRAIDYLRERPNLTRDVALTIDISDSVCKFDLLQCLYWVFHSQDTDPYRDSYASSALLSPAKVEPLILELLDHAGPASVIEPYDAESLGRALAAFREVARPDTFFSFGGWANEGWSNERISSLLSQTQMGHPS